MASINDIGTPGSPMDTPPLTEWQAAVRDALNGSNAAMNARIDAEYQALATEAAAVSWNDVKAAGFHPKLMHGVTNPNGPGLANYYYLTVYTYGANTFTQVAVPYTNVTGKPTFAYRVCYNGTFYGWQVLTPSVPVSVAFSAVAGWTGSVSLARTGCLVTLTVNAVSKATTQGTLELIAAIPAGYRPPGVTVFTTYDVNYGPTRVSSSLYLDPDELKGWAVPVAAYKHYGTITYLTNDPFP